MPRLTMILAVLVGILAGGLGIALLPRETTDDAAVRSIVTAMLAEKDDSEIVLPASVAALDPELLNPMIKDYLLANPRLLEQMSTALNTENKLADADAARLAIASMQTEIFADPSDIVLGNPAGDVTLVEMFDYNCGYCRGALPDLATLLAEDPNLKVILKEFPILSQGSLDAAQVGVLVSQADVDYWAYHEALFTSRGQVSKETALDAAEALGLSRASLETGMLSDPVAKQLDKTFAIADALKVSGTPTYIIGDEIIPGAIGIDSLRQRIANMRACGKTDCAA
ncbi:MAG: Protein-disulfide isomerase [Devosia sp.]|nr:Protein-disulfide isomerase [Devosia sp.]